MKPLDAKTNEHYVAMLEKAADSFAKRSPGGLEQGLRQAQQAAEFRLKGTRGAKRRKLKSVIAKLSKIRVDRGSSATEAAFAMERLQELQLELISLGSGWRPSDLPRQPRKHRGGRPRKVTLPEVKKSRRARILDDL
jgi:hypothetical protein